MNAFVFMDICILLISLFMFSAGYAKVSDHKELRTVPERATEAERLAIGSTKHIEIDLKNTGECYGVCVCACVYVCIACYAV